MNSIKIERKNGYAIVQLDQGKVNAINLSLSQDLISAFEKLQEDEDTKGVILTGRPHCFSAGLDVVEMANNNFIETKDFWRAYLKALHVMIHFPKPLVSAITGYAPAGATIFALCADYRIMGRGPKHVIGMHEFNMSMQIPKMLCNIFAYHMGEKKAWESVLNARLYNSDQAIDVGLVNESCEVEEVMELAEKRLKKYISVYAPVFKKTKEYLRKDLHSAIDMDIENAVNTIAEDWSDPFVQESIKMFITSISKK